ncbi:hypothetical protein MKW98_020225 [Papaver atlanticum]|uniref:FBD domain-containing protein n=1 Tax=Papaver atlanticum TaxID=357466 RepID=A0AAD4S9B4_9MAGN|nr:hypothetical protein MKW98_020225 [Papaver atlanticum]
MKFAVQTSVLSKRWKNIWMSLPYISSDWKSFREGGVIDAAERFLTFVDKVFEFRNDSVIQKIKLVFVILNDISVQALNRWILAAVDHNVQRLDINGAHADNLAYEIPYELLNCKSLKSLTILLLGVSTDIILPNSMSLPQIKKMWLGGISISNLELQRLFSSCPLMEDATIQKCLIHSDSQRNIIIDSQRLGIFKVLDNHHKHLGLDDHFLTYSDKIFTPNLRHFICSGFMTEGFSLQNPSSLVTAQFRMRLREKEDDETAETYSELPAEEKEVFAKRMMKFLGAVHNVRQMTLSSGFLEVLLQAPGSLYLQPPQLSKLVILELEMRFTRSCLRSIAYLLNISPLLIILELKSKESNLADIKDDWEAEFSLACMFTHLKVVEIREVEGCDNEVQFLRFLLKKSTVLEKVNLFFQSTGGSHDNGRQVRRFKRNLRVLPTASSNIKMNFM